MLLSSLGVHLSPASNSVLRWSDDCQSRMPGQHHSSMLKAGSLFAECTVVQAWECLRGNACISGQRSNVLLHSLRGIVRSSQQHATAQSVSSFGSLSALPLQVLRSAV